MNIYSKYPSTPFLPWAKPDTDGRRIKSLDSFEGRRVVVTEKLDGENTSMYCDHIHARSLDSANHPSRNMVKGIWGRIKHQIPTGMKICGENMYAVHSIAYDNLLSYFFAFSIWEEEKCLGWDETLDWLNYFHIYAVPHLYEGIFDAELIQNLWSEDMRGTSEGYVVRLADSYTLSEFPLSIAKFVRKGHVQTDQHWMKKEIVPNKLK